VLAFGVGYKKRGKARAGVVPESYVDGLRELNTMIGSLMRTHGGETFNSQLFTMRERIRFQLARTPAKDREAVEQEIRAGCCEAEEIAELLPLSIDEIRAICAWLVNESGRGYEFRPIGKKPKRGVTRIGIFRKDAPAHVVSILTRQAVPDFYSVDRSGLRAAVNGQA
jgi:hypothetical protein